MRFKTNPGPLRSLPVGDVPRPPTPAASLAELLRQLLVPERLEPEERNRVYKMLDLTVSSHEDGKLELRWAPGGDPCGDNGLLLPDSCRTPGR